MNHELLTLRILHIIGGTFWVGSGLFTTFFLIPALGTVGPAAGPVMAALQARRLYTVLPAVAVVTIVSGARLMWITSGGFDGSYFARGSGQVFAGAAIAAVLAFAISTLYVRPAAERASRIGAELASAPDERARAALGAEMGAVRSRMGTGSTAAVVLLIVAAVGMAIGRYVP